MHICSSILQVQVRPSVQLQHPVPNVGKPRCLRDSFHQYPLALLQWYA